MVDAFAKIDANPYSWPFDGRWKAQDSAVLLLGFQSGVVEALDAGAELAVAARLAAAAREHGLTVIATRRGSAGENSAIAARRHDMGDHVPTPGTPGWQLADGLGVPADATVFDHPGDNAFYTTGLEALLRSCGIRNLIVAGLPTEGLLHATQRAANDMGFECLAVADACKGTSEARHDGQLRITTFGNGLFGAVAGSEAVIAAFS